MNWGFAVFEAYGAYGVGSRFDSEVANMGWVSVPTAARVLEQRVGRHPLSHAVDEDDGGEDDRESGGARSWRVGPGDEAGRDYSLILPQPGSPPQKTRRKKMW